MSKTKYVAASTVIVVTMIGSTISSIRFVRAQDLDGVAQSSNSSIEYVTDKEPEKFLEGKFIRGKYSQVREKMDNTELITALGVTIEEFHALKKEGKSLKEMADQNSIDPQSVTQIIEKQTLEKWERMLTNGILDQEKFDELVSQLDEIAVRHFEKKSMPLKSQLQGHRAFKMLFQ